MSSNKTSPVRQSIIQAFKEGDEKAFTEIFHLYSDKIFYFAQTYVHNPADAEEITQNVFVKLWESRTSVDPGANFNAYIFTIARNIIFNRHKKMVHEWNYIEYLKNHLKNNNDTEQTVLLDEVSDILHQHIDAMPKKRKLVFELSRIKGLSHKEISQQLNISAKTVEVHIGLALKALRVALKDYS